MKATIKYSSGGLCGETPQEQIEGIVMNSEEKSPEDQIPHIVDLKERHIDQVLTLMIDQAWYYYDDHEIKRYLKLGEACYVLQDGARTLGSIFTTNYGNQSWIGNVVVHEGQRKKGYGTKLIHSTITRLVQQGRETFRLASVPEAIKFYQKPPLFL